MANIYLEYDVKHGKGDIEKTEIEKEEELWKDGIRIIIN